MKKTSAKPKTFSSKSSRAERRYALKPEIFYREVEGQILILTPREEFLYTINASGKLVWQLLVRGTTERKLVNALVAEYELDRGQAQQDVQIFLRDLRTRGILAQQ